MHLPKDALVGGNDELLIGHLQHRLDELGSGANHIGLIDHLVGGFRVDQDGGLRVQAPDPVEGEALEFLMDDAGPGPEQHLRPRHPFHVVAQVFVRGPEDLKVLGVEVFNDGQGDTGGHHPIRAGLDRRRGVGIDDHHMFRVLVAEGPEQVRRTTFIQGAGGRQVRHEDALFRIENLGGLAHKADTADNQGAGRTLTAEARHLQGIGNKATRLLCQFLEVAIRVVVRDQDGIPLR